MDASRLLEIHPPHSPQAEEKFIGVCVSEPNTIDDGLDRGLTKEDFFNPTYGDVWNIISEMRRNNSSIDLSTIIQFSEDRKYILDIGKIGEACAGVFSFSSHLEYLNTILEKSKLRKLQVVCKNIIYETVEMEHEPDKVISHAEEKILEINSARGCADFKYQDIVAKESLREIEKIREKRKELNALGKNSQPIGLPTGFRELDRVTTGFKGGQMVIVAARPSIGKTSFVMQMKDTIAEHGFPVGVISLEMTAESLMMKTLSGHSGINSRIIRAGNTSDSELEKLNKSCYEVSKLPIIYVDVPRLSVAQLISKSRRLVSRHGVRAIVIDYIQLMSGDDNFKRLEEVNEISRTIKALALELNITMIGIAQLNRRAEDGEPQMHHLRESGNLEQDADIVLLLHRLDQAAHHKQFEYPMSLILAKHREGPITKIDLTFDGERTKFIE